MTNDKTNDKRLMQDCELKQINELRGRHYDQSAVRLNRLDIHYQRAGRKGVARN